MRAVRASLCESELCLPRFAAAIASCHAASQRAAFALRAVPPRCCERCVALRQGYVHNCAHDSRCALLATRRFSLLDAMDCSQRARRGCSGRRGLRSKTRRGTLRVQRKTRRSRWLKVSAGLPALTASFFAPSAPARF